MTELAEALVVLLWAPLLALDLLVLFSYQVAWRHRPAETAGLLPIHVAVVAFSYLILATLATVDVIFDEVSAWQAWTVIVALAAGLVAMVVVLRYERLRIPIKERSDGLRTSNDSDEPRSGK